MKFLKRYAYVLIFALCASCADMACMEQYDAKPFWNKLKEEERIANKPTPTLNEDGTLKKEL